MNYESFLNEVRYWLLKLCSKLYHEEIYIVQRGESFEMTELSKLSTGLGLRKKDSRPPWLCVTRPVKHHNCFLRINKSNI